MRCLSIGILVGVAVIQVAEAKGDDGHVINEKPLTFLDSENRTVVKPFGLGVGPFFLGGSSVRPEARKVVERIYRRFVNLKMMTSRVEDKDYYEEFVEKDLCVMGCNNTSDYEDEEEMFSLKKSTPHWRKKLFETGASCLAGMCFCQRDRQRFGLCDPEKNGVVGWSLVKFNYPDYIDTFISSRGKHTQEEDSSKRKRLEWNDKYSPLEQACPSNNTHNFHCNTIDINFVCEDGLCKCRRDMRYNQEHYECELYIDVDCSDVTDDDLRDGDIIDMINGKQKISRQYPVKDVQKTFCVIIDLYAQLYADLYWRPQPKEPRTALQNFLDGLQIFGGVILFATIAFCATNCCGKCIPGCRYLRRCHFVEAVDQFSQRMNPQSNPVDTVLQPIPPTNQYLPAHAQPGYLQPHQMNAQPGYSQPGYSQQGYPQPGYSQPGYPQPEYPQSGYPQPGYPQPQQIGAQAGLVQGGYLQSVGAHPGLSEEEYPQKQPINTKPREEKPDCGHLDWNEASNGQKLNTCVKQ